MGKTTLLKKLRNECDSIFWTIDVDLKKHKELFKTKPQTNELLNRLIEGNENNFSKHIRDVFRSKKKLYFFIDGLDELEDCCVENVLDFVKKLLSERFHVWISCLKNLKTKLEDRFGNFAMNIEEMEKEQQEFYIKNRLKKNYNHEQIVNIIGKILNSSDIENNCHVLGKVLQLYIITQIFLNYKEVDQHIPENTFVCTKMLDLFFRGIIADCQNKEQDPILGSIKVEYILQACEHLALRSMFSEEVLEKLKVKNMKNGRPLLCQPKKNDMFEQLFEHFTYVEYFAARFFAKNKHEFFLIKEELVSNGRKKLILIHDIIVEEDNPQHLAKIYANVNQTPNIVSRYAHPSVTPLHLAAKSGNLETAKTLITKGTSVNVLTNSNLTPLHYAAESGNAAMAAFLIEKGAIVGALTTNHQTPLQLAIQSGNSETIALLTNEGASVG
jgi:hypothetical protein